MPISTDDLKPQSSQDDFDDDDFENIDASFADRSASKLIVDSQLENPDNLSDIEASHPG